MGTECASIASLPRSCAASLTCSATAVSVGLNVLRGLHAKVCEGSGGSRSGMELLLQIDGIGAARLGRLGEAGMRTVRRLASLVCYHIERLMSWTPLYGQTLLRQLAELPPLILAVESLRQDKRPEGGGDGGGLWMVPVLIGYENKALSVWKGRTPWVLCVLECLDGKEREGLVWFGRGSAKRLADDGSDGKEALVGVTGYQLVS